MYIGFKMLFCETKYHVRSSICILNNIVKRKIIMALSVKKKHPLTLHDGIDWQDVRQAAEAMGRLQGFVLLSSDRGGIRIEYAKNKMGEVVSGI